MRSATARNIFAVVAGGVIATIAASGILFSNAYTTMKASSIREMEQTAQATALSIQGSLGAPIKLIDTLNTTLATTVTGGGASGPDRDAVNRLLSNLLESNKGLLATWTAFEPNAFDGKDTAFAGARGHDQTGRFVPYWFRDGSTVDVTPLLDYTKPGAGDYYLKPLTEKRPVVIEPYPYMVNGKEILITSITKPVIINGKPVGVAGLDLSLADTRAYLSSIRPMGDGWVGLVTGNGNIVGHRDAALAGKTLKDMPDGQQWADLIARPSVSQEITGADGEASFAVAYPIDLGEGNTWYAVATVPGSTVLAALNAMAIQAVVIVAVAAGLLALGGWLIARRFVGRIANVIAETDEIAKGRLDVVLKDRERDDELGSLARSLDILLQNNRRKVDLETEAEQNRLLQEQERDERARVTAAKEADVRFAVTELGAALGRLADGDLTTRLQTPFAGALDGIRADFNGSVEKLEQALMAFRQNAETIRGGSTEIQSAADDLARRTEQQAASVEETAAALEQITTSVKDAAMRAQEAGKLVAFTRTGAERSGEVVRNAIEAMQKIEKSSQEISNIIGVIDEIAFQTNLLALNAGVEAARAGEAGKGFAVVAQEVRELAQRSAKAAKEIKDLIGASGAHVRSGVALVDQTGTELQSIVTEVHDIDLNIQAIAQAAREQATGLQEINSAVNQMDHATQQNAGMVEESNAATHTLVNEVHALMHRLGQFRLGNGMAVDHRTEEHAAPMRLRA